MKSRTKKHDAAEKAARRPHMAFNIRVDPSIGSRFKAIVEAIRPKVDVTAMLEFLMERYIQENQPSE